MSGERRRPRPRLAISFLAFGLCLAVAAAGCNKAETDAVSLVNQGVRALERGDTGTARSYFSRAARLNPENSSAHYHLGLMEAYHKADARKAMVHFETAERLAPADPDVLFQLGRVTTVEGDPTKGLAYLERALDVDPHMAPAWYFAGAAHAALEQAAQADTAWREAIAIDPKDHRAFLDLAELYESHGHDEAARGVYEAGLRHNLGSPDLLNGLGVLELRQGSVEAAIEHLADALSRDASRTDILFNLAFAYAQDGRTKDAIAHLGAFLRNADAVEEATNMRVARALRDTLMTEQRRRR